MSKKQKQTSSFNAVKWLVVFLLLAGGLALNYQYIHIAWGIRGAVGLLYILGLLFIVLTTTQGASAKRFMQASKIELRKVVWPTRQETVQMAFIVAVMVMIASVLLWGFDALFFYLVSVVTR